MFSLVLNNKNYAKKSYRFRTAMKKKTDDGTTNPFFLCIYVEGLLLLCSIKAYFFNKYLGSLRVVQGA